MESSLIRILPACLTEPLPAGWQEMPEGFVLEVMPGVERPEVVLISLQTTEPDILILDADFPDYDAFEMARQSIAARPGMAVLVISENNAPDQLRRAMLAGVEEYLIKPLEADALRESLVAIASNRSLRTVEAEHKVAATAINGVVVGVMSGKGGLGKTTIATNMAALLAKATRKPIGLVGFESGDGAVLLSLQPKMGLLDMAGNMGADEAAYSPEWLRQFGTPHRNGLMYWTWQGTATRVGEIPEDFLPNLFETCRRTNEYTFIDFPLLSEDEMGTVLPLLDIIIVVSSTSDLLALRSTKTFLELVPEELRPRMRIVVNRADPTDMISKEDFQTSVGHRIAAILPNDPQLTAQAINMGAPFVITSVQGELSHQVRALGEQLFHLPLVQETTKSKRRFSFF